MRGTLEWFSGLNVVQKVLAVLFAGLLLFSASYLVTSGYLRLVGGGDQTASPVEESAAPESPGSTASASASAGTTAPEFSVEITSARWEGEKAVVEGTWNGDLDISSVHCDLIEGSVSGSSTDWWDRSVGPDMDFQKGTFSQEFVEAAGRKIEHPIDPAKDYWALCASQFSSGWSTSDSAQVKGTPPG